MANVYNKRFALHACTGAVAAIAAAAAFATPTLAARPHARAHIASAAKPGADPICRTVATPDGTVGVPCAGSPAHGGGVPPGAGVSK